MYEFAVAPAITQLRRPGVLISEVAPESLAEELELAPDDRIVRVNGRVVRDYLDFRFQTAAKPTCFCRSKSRRAKLGKSKSSAKKAKISV